MTTSASRPSSAARTASSWPGRKRSKPKYWWREACKSIGPATLAAGAAGTGVVSRRCCARCGVVARDGSNSGDKGVAGWSGAVRLTLCAYTVHFVNLADATPADQRGAPAGTAGVATSIANFPREAKVFSNGKSPEKHASQCESRGAWIASYTPSSDRYASESA